MAQYTAPQVSNGFMQGVQPLNRFMQSVQRLLNSSNTTNVTAPRHIQYVHAKALQCPVVCHQWSADPFSGCFTPLQMTCKNHALDSISCGIGELCCFVVLLYSTLYTCFVVGALHGLKKKLEEAKGSPMHTGESQEGVSPGTGYMGLNSQRPGRPDFSAYAYHHHPESGDYFHARLGSLVDKHSRLVKRMQLVRHAHAIYDVSDKMLTFLNVIIPSCSIVLQGVLKVAGDSHKEGTYQDTATVVYKAYDLDECARRYRNGMVAFFTIVAIVYAAFGKAFRLAEQAGEKKAELNTLEEQLNDFDEQLNMAGSKKSHGSDEGSGSGSGSRG